jgi:pantothenate kinase type III
MILAVDIGNTNIVIGCMEKGRAALSLRLATNRDATELEYAEEYRDQGARQRAYDAHPDAQAQPFDRACEHVASYPVRSEYMAE